MSEAGAWPVPFEIEAIDPYPYHGLVYTEGDVQWLEPGGGRPRIELPSLSNVPTPRPGPRYAPLESSAVWDVGHPDPPVSPHLYALGGTSLGRRLVATADSLTKLPQSGLRALALSFDGEEIYLRDVTPGQIEKTVASAQVPTSAILSGITELVNPYTGNSFEVHLATMDELDRSADGRRRLVAFRWSNGTGANLVTFYVGVAVVEITESAAGDLSLDITITATANDCLGVTSYDRESDLFWWSPAGRGDDIPPDSGVPIGVNVSGEIAVGSFLEEHAVADVIIGAYLDGDNVRYFYADVEVREDQSSDTSGSHIINADGDSYFMHWEVSKTRVTDGEITLRNSGGGEVSVHFHRTITSTLSATNNNRVPGYAENFYVGSYSINSSATMTGLPADQDSQDTVIDERPGEAGAILRLGQDAVAIRDIGGAIPSGARIAPRRIEVGRISANRGDYARATESDTRCSKTKGLVIYERGDGVPERPARVPPTISPSGVHGTMAVIPPGGGGTYPARALYNPLTDQVARAADYPDRYLNGWI